VAPLSQPNTIEQLQYEGFSRRDAERAIDRISFDGNAEADEKAASYIALSGSSRAGRIEQFRYEGFTSTQAAHGASSVRL
jgi:colicin import membrane protein